MYTKIRQQAGPALSAKRHSEYNFTQRLVRERKRKMTAAGNFRQDDQTKEEKVTSYPTDQCVDMS